MLRRYREERREAVRAFVGHHWSEEGSTKRRPVNLIAQYVTIVGRSLIAKNPRVMLSTFDPTVKPTVKALEGWANKEIENDPGLQIPGLNPPTSVETLYFMKKD